MSSGLCTSTPQSGDSNTPSITMELARGIALYFVYCTLTVGAIGIDVVLRATARKIS